jgi:hypothetical protein
VMMESAIELEYHRHHLSRIFGAFHSRCSGRGGPDGELGAAHLPDLLRSEPDIWTLPSHIVRPRARHKATLLAAFGLIRSGSELAERISIVTIIAMCYGEYQPATADSETGTL